jgi:Subunit 21 of Mediator complex
MFEALRGLRDAVAPESGNLAAAAGGGVVGSSSSSNSSIEPDLEDLWHAYRKGDPNVVAMFQKVSSSSSGSSSGTTPAAANSTNNICSLRREDFVRLHAKMEMEKDTGLVLRLAKTVIDKSEEIDDQVDALPGMNRTRAEQMQMIERLIAENAKAAADLQVAYDQAKERRDASRKFIREETCKALGIEEETSAR